MPQVVDPRKVRMYMFLIKMGRITIDEVPEPYKTAILELENV